MKIKGYILATISAIFYGLLPLFILPIKAIHYPINTTLFYRLFLAAMSILSYLLYKKESLKVNKKEMLVLVILGFLYALSTDFLLLGYDALTPGIASTILYAFPVIVVLIMTVFFKEKINRIAIISLIITMVGIVILGAQNSILVINFKGLVVSLLSALFYALYIVIVNQSRIKVSGFKLTFYSLLISSMYYLGKMLLFGESISIPDFGVLLNLILFSFVSTVLSITTLVYAIKFIGSTSTSIMGAFEPIVAIVVSVTIFGERLTLNLIAGVILILAGVILNIVSNSRILNEH